MHLHHTLGFEGLCHHQIWDVQGQHLHLLQLLTLLRRQWLVGVTRSLLIPVVLHPDILLVASLRVDSEFRRQHILLLLCAFCWWMTKEEKKGGLKLINLRCVCVCAVDVACGCWVMMWCIELDMDDGCMDVFVLIWVCWVILSRLVKTYLYHIKDLWTWDSCIVCYQVYLSCFKC